VIYRVAQEAMTNVARHARATSVHLRLARANDQVVLTVRDDGRGLARGAETSSQGIRGMRERALLVGGQLTIVPAPDHGTEVKLSIPLDGRKP
jgi:two-component system sensor histidine kinase UhpB